MKNLEIKEYKNKYCSEAENIYSLIGEHNYHGYTNCMTRFRVNIIDKSLVNVDALKKLPLVKGIHWNGTELQIIIGGEVVKVIDEFKKYEEELAKPKTQSKESVIQKKSFGSRFLGALTGIMAPAVPLMMAVGLLMAIYNLLTLPGSEILQTSVVDPTGALDPEGNPVMIGISMATLNYFNLESAIAFVLSQVILNTIGIYFIYNTTKYFKGNTLFALVVGLTLMSRGFFPADSWGVPYDQAGFGDWTHGVAGTVFARKTGFLLFKLGDFPVVVGGYEGTIIPYIIGGIVVTYVDKWIKSWMPNSIDIVFRATLVYLLTIFSLWFLLAPISSLLEFGLVTAMNWLGAIPYGVGTGLMALFWQPLVLTGFHIVLGTSMGIQIATEHYSLLRPATSIAVWGQIGAVIGVIIMTKNVTLRRVGLGVLPAGLFGITEPIIYGINLPKVKPFLFGCIGGMVGAVISGILKIAIISVPADGVFTVLAYETPLSMGLAVMTWLIAILVSMGLVILFYTERKNEYSYFKKAINKLISLNGKNDKELINEEFKPYFTEIKSMKDEYNKVNKYYSQISKHEQEMITLENKESKHREKMYKKLVKLKSKLLKKDNQELLNKFNHLNNLYSTYNLDKEKEKVQTTLNKLNADYSNILSKFDTEKETIYQNATEKVNKFNTSLNLNDTESIKNMMWNALNSVEIGYEVVDNKPIGFTKSKKQLFRKEVK